MSNEQKTSLTYKQSGVNIGAGNQLVDRIKKIAKSTQRAEVLGSIGGFSALCEIPKSYQEPVLVSATDGVGTKLKIAIDLDMHQTIGIDLVAMCVNDLIVTGAEPLFFLDYYASGKLDSEVAIHVIEGIGEGCRQAGCALVGGETAEMPGMYQKNDYDLAGFCVGVAERSKIIDGSLVKEGDQLIALGSSGIHSNGYSLVRKILSLNETQLNETLDGKTLAELLLEPTRIYVKSILQLNKTLPLHGLSHITGGGILENLPRVLPQDLSACIDKSSWQWPNLFDWLQDQGNITEEEMYQTFNCGVGMILIVAKEKVKASLQHLKESGEKAWCLGSIARKEKNSKQCVIFK